MRPRLTTQDALRCRRFESFPAYTTGEDMPYKDPEKLRQYKKDWDRAKNQTSEGRTKAKNTRGTRRRSYKNNVWVEYSKYKRTLKCISCPEDHPATLQFHHRNPDDKSFEIAGAVSRGVSWGIILEEIKKCDVLCANCHAKLHWHLKEIQVAGTKWEIM